jgi:ribosomal protein L37AE/L43A
MASIADRAWVFISMSDGERSWSANEGYDDSVGIYYSYDSNVAQSRQVHTGDIVIIRVDSDVAGWGIIEHIDVVPDQAKLMIRCPSCQKARHHRRTRMIPTFKCDNRSCGYEFEENEAIKGFESVTSFRAYYANTWTEAARPIDFRELAKLQMSTSTFNAIRPLDPELLAPFLDKLSGRDVNISVDFSPDDVRNILGGHVETVVRRRRGQRAFRFEMMRRYGEECAFSGAQPPQALEAAHLYSFAKRPEHRSDGGLLLRRDYHSLFDAKLLTVNPGSMKIEIAPRLFNYPSYRKLEGAALRIQGESTPSLELLGEHYEQAVRVFSHN